MLNVLLRYPWPGNVRELENAIERAVVLSNDEDFNEDLLPLSVRMFAAQRRSSQSSESIESLTKRLADQAVIDYELREGEIYQLVIDRIEHALIDKALGKCGNGVKTKAADFLGINRNTLNKKVKELGIETVGVTPPGAGARWSTRRSSTGGSKGSSGESTNPGGCRTGMLDVLNRLSTTDDWPPLVRGMFALPAAWPVGTYRQQVIHFGGSFKDESIGLGTLWVGKFEGLLRQLYWLTAVVHVETEIGLPRVWRWTPTDAALARLGTGDPPPMDDWVRT